MPLTTPRDSGLRTLRILLTLSAAALASIPGAAQTGTGSVRVSPTGANTGTCGAAATPCLTVQKGVDEAAAGDVVRVATGTYSTTASCLGTAAVVCILNKHVTILGGFPPGNWTTPTPSVTPTVLDGLNANRVILVQDTSGPSSASLTLQGVTVTRGFVVGAASGSENAITAFGGGINATNARLTLTDVVISFNRARGGGATSSTPDDHGGAGAGGGIAVLGTAELSVLTRVVFDGNAAEGGGRSGGGTKRGGYGQGGGLFVFQSQLEGYDLTFTNNQALGGDAPSATGSGQNGQLADGQGAGVCVQIGSNVLLDGVTATGNLTIGGDAQTNTGGLGGGAFGSAVFSELATLTLRNFSLSGNQALGGVAHTGGLGSGGAVMATGSGSTVTLERGTIADNLSKGGGGTSTAGSAGGGAAYFTGSSVIAVTNVIMADNAAELGDLGSGGAGGGGAMFLQTTSGSVVHATLARNRLGAAGMQGEGAVLLGGSDVDFDYTIFAEHTSMPGANALHVQPGNTATLQRGIFSGNGQNAAGGGTINGVGTMLTFADVEFVAPGSPLFDYHLQETSPAIDQATGSTTATDVDGETRTTQDIGADEYVFLAVIFSDGFESGNTSAWTATVP